MKHLVPPVGLLGLVALLALEGCRSESRASTQPDSSSNSLGGAPGTSTIGTTGAAGASGERNTATETTAGDAVEPACPFYDPAATEDETLVRLHAPDKYEIYVLGVVGKFAYFVEGTELRRVPHGGGGSEVLGTIGNSWVRLLNEERVLWVEPTADGESLRIVVAPLSDPTDVSVVAETKAAVATLVVDENDVIWSSRDPHNVYRAPLEGGTPQLLVAGGEPLGSVVFAGYYYWIDAASDHLERIEVGGGQREELTPALFGGPMAASGDVVVWGDTVLSTIEKWSPETGRVSLAAAIDPLEVEVVDGTVFWSQGLLSGAVRSIGLDGSDSQDLLCRLRPRPSIHVGDDFLLVGGGSGLLRLAR